MTNCKDKQKDCVSNSYDRYSVLMSLYYKENPEHFRAAIDSMLNQTITPDEIVLVEDGWLSKELHAIIGEIKERYPGLITSVVNEKNIGLGLALQKGVKSARNNIIARMDTDDIAVLNRCEKELEYLNKHQNVSVVGGQIEEFINDRENIVGKRQVPCNDADIKRYMKRRCPFNHMTVMFRKEDILNAGNYQELFWNEDYYLWLRLALINKKFGNLSETLVYVRTGKDMYSRRGGIRYFKSEKRIQDFMLEKGVISNNRYLINMIERFILQIVMPNWLRGIVFRKFARN